MKFPLILLLLFSTFFGKAQTDEVREDLANRFIMFLSSKQYSLATGLFDDKMMFMPDAERLERTWKGLLLHSGNFLGSDKTTSFSLAGNNFVIVTCRFEKTNLDLKASFNQQNQINNIVFLPTRLDDEYIVPSYVKKRKFREKEIYFKAGDFLIPGTLTLPRCGKNLPLVVLVHGAGPMDRDNTVGSIKMFKDIAWGLASKKVAVIRYDKRTFIYAARISEYYGDKYTINEEIVADAIAAINFSKGLKKISQEKIFVAGHDLGGMVAPRIAGMKTGLAGLIVMASCARPYEDLLLEQLRYSGTLPAINGVNSEPINIEQLERQVALVKNPLLNVETRSTELPLNLSANYWLDLRNYNQVASAKNARIPILFMQGEKDRQVPLLDFDIWRNSLKNTGQVEFRLYNELNHFFNESLVALDGKGYSGSVPVEVVNDIIKWVKKQKKAKKAPKI